MVNQVRAFIPRELITYRWTVVPTGIEDVYIIHLESTFETKVPVPVVVLDGPDDLSWLAPGQTVRVDFTLTNQGLIAAKNVELSLPHNPGFEFKALVDKIGTLPAKSSVTVPVLVTRKVQESSPQSLHARQGEAELTPAGNGSGNCVTLAVARYEYECGPDNVLRLVYKGIRLYQVCYGAGAGWGWSAPPPIIQDPCKECCEPVKYTINVSSGWVGYCLNKGFTGQVCLDGIHAGYAIEIGIKNCTNFCEHECTFKVDHHVPLIDKSCWPKSSSEDVLVDGMLLVTDIEESEGNIAPGELAIGLGYASVEDMEQHLGIEIPEGLSCWTPCF